MGGPHLACFSSDKEKSRCLLADADAQALHLPIQMTPFQSQRFRRAAYIPMAFIDLLQDVIPFVSFPGLVQSAEFFSLAAIPAEDQHGQVLAFDAYRKRVQDHHPLDHISQLADISPPM